MLNRRVGLCKGDSTIVGVNSSPYSFTWSPVIGLSDDTISNPIFQDTIGRTYYIAVEDRATGCKGADSVWVSVYNLPDVAASSSPYSFCAGSTVNLNVETSTGVQFTWMPATYLSDSNQQSPVFYSPEAGVYDYSVKVTDRNMCSNETSVRVVNNELPKGELTELGGAGNITEGYEANVEGKMNGSAYFNLYLGYQNDPAQFIDSFSSLPVVAQDVSRTFDYGFLEFVSDSGCVNKTDTVPMFWLSVKNVFVSDIEVYPNPTSSILNIKNGGVFIRDIRLTNLNGVVLKSQTDLQPSGHHELSLNGLSEGMYILYLTDELGLTYQKKIVKLD